MTIQELSNPHCTVTPRYWVAQQEVDSRLNDWQRDWLLGFRDITNTTNERTAIFSLLPRVAVGNNAPLMILQDSRATLVLCLLGSLNSFAFDCVARQKVGGTHMNFFILSQLPVLPPERYTPQLLDYIVPRVLELVYTAWDMLPFAQDVLSEWRMQNGEWTMPYTAEGVPIPFTWDTERRFQLRCELDALYFHLYAITREDVDYIMDTFPIVRRKDEQQHGDYRTRRVILEMYDEMAGGITSYRTRLDPPPGDARARHGAGDAE
jgi:hypothetical protein